MRRLRTEEEVGGRVGGEWYIVETKKQPKEEKEIKGWEELKVLVNMGNCLPCLQNPLSYQGHSFLFVIGSTWRNGHSLLLHVPEV